MVQLFLCKCPHCNHQWEVEVGNYVGMFSQIDKCPKCNQFTQYKAIQKKVEG